jgi:hypothetical protein
MNYNNIRYINLGVGGSWWTQCKEEKIIKLGFHSGDPKVFAWAQKEEWDQIQSYWRQQGVGTPTQHTNAMKQFFEDDGTTLWITFAEGCLYHAFSDGGEITPIAPTGNEEGCSYRKLKNQGWSNQDQKGNILHMHILSGRLTRTAGFMQTICKFSEDVEAYIGRILRGEENADLAKARKAKKELEDIIERLVESFTWQDFELLIELIFSQSGMQKTSRLGGPQRTSDLDLKNPITGDRYFVQVKSWTNQAQFNDYLNRYENERSSFSRMYYVYHTGNVNIDNISEEDGVEVWDIHTVAKHVVDNGLVDWVFDRSY